MPTDYDDFDDRGGSEDRGGSDNRDRFNDRDRPDNRDGFDDHQGQDDDLDDLDDTDDDLDDADGPGLPWPPTGYPPPGYPQASYQPGTYPPGGYPPRSRGGRRGWLLAVTAAIAALCGFGVVALAVHDVTSNASPGASAASPSPGAGSATPGGGAQNQFPGGGALPPQGSGQQERLEIGGKVTAVSATSITIGGGPAGSVMAAVTAATKVTGNVSSIHGVKVGDFVVVLITRVNGKLTVQSIQDPASLS